jgi:ribosomal-protein-alanine N-acetyltransferase
VPSSIALRAIRGDDWVAVHEWASSEVACRYQAWGPNTEQETREFVDQAVASWLVEPQERYVWMAERSGIVVGLGELKLRSRRWEHAEISYAVHIRHWGQGYATAIATELLTFAFQSLDLHRVTGTCDPRNLASDAVLRKIGMTYEGRLRHTIRLRDGWRDSNLYSMLSDEWLGGKQLAGPAAQRGDAPPADEASL